MTWPDHISVYHKLRKLPQHKDDSFQLDVLIMSELKQRAAATCLEDIVVYDYKKGRKTEIPKFMMDAFRHAWAEQEESKERSREKIEEVESMVRKLEMGTWDRKGAVEDMG